MTSDRFLSAQRARRWKSHDLAGDDVETGKGCRAELGGERVLSQEKASRAGSQRLSLRVLRLWRAVVATCRRDSSRRETATQKPAYHFDQPNGRNSRRCEKVPEDRTSEDTILTLGRGKTISPLLLLALGVDEC
jgi:hypothetical protein